MSVQFHFEGTIVNAAANVIALVQGGRKAFHLQLVSEMYVFSVTSCRTDRGEPCLTALTVDFRLPMQP